MNGIRVGVCHQVIRVVGRPEIRPILNRPARVHQPLESASVASAEASERTRRIRSLPGRASGPNAVPQPAKDELYIRIHFCYIAGTLRSSSFFGNSTDLIVHHPRRTALPLRACRIALHRAETTQQAPQESCPLVSPSENFALSRNETTARLVVSASGRREVPQVDLTSPLLD